VIVSTLRSTPHHVKTTRNVWAIVALSFLLIAVAPHRANAAEASCYGPGLFGNHMANGQTLTRSTLGVANKTLPLGTRLFVRSRGRTVRVRVTDRGPFVAGRILDLTHGTVVALGYADCYAFGHRDVTTWRAR
jgi:rare lipoprotein A (peptidoglycan hydrolase)